jgi:hypothetical protein
VSERLRELFRSVFMETFPIHISYQIFEMVESGQITRATGRKLLDAYMSAHGRMLVSAEAINNPARTLNEELVKVGLLEEEKP